MSVKNKRRRGSILDPKNLVVTSIAAIFVVLVAVAMSFMQPKLESNRFDEEAWRSAVKEAEEKNTPADSGELTSVYSEPAVETVAEVSQPIEENKTEEATTEQNQVTKEKTENTAPNTLRLAPPIAGAVSFDYSGDELVYSKTMQDWRTHNGVDYAAPEGTEVFAAAAGNVEAVTDGGMFGTTVIILHDGGIRTIYSNLDSNEHIAAGESVAQGTVIGKVGSTAAAEAAEEAHLHFEVSKNEETVNPHDYLPETSETE